MFTVHVGPVGSGKTFSMVREGMLAYERGETIFTNVDLDPERGGWSAENGGRIVRWKQPMDLLRMDVRCGTVLWDELGASVNNREYEIWPVRLTIKIIEHRKEHLDFHATVQDDELADKNVRRFYNRVYFVREWRLPLLGAILPTTHREPLPCPNEQCNKGNHFLTGGDLPTFGTVYRAKDVHPKYTQNKDKHESRGYRFIPYDPRVALAYSSASRVASEASEYYEEARRRRNRERFQR